MGVSQSQATGGDSRAAIALFGAPPGDMANVPGNDGEVVLSQTNAAQLGNVTAITGASGSGKSSLLALGSTLIRPDKGRVYVDGADVTSVSAADAANLIPSLTAIDQLAVMKELRGKAKSSTRKAAREHATDILESIGLGDELNKRPHQLSGGQRQRINIARALMNRPSLLVVDEPTSALDSKLGSEIIDLVLEITRKHNTATMLVTHDRTHLPMMDNVTEMRDGKLRQVR